MNIVISHPGRKHWRWELLSGRYRMQFATGDVHSLREAWKAARGAERHATRLGLR